MEIHPMTMSGSHPLAPNFLSVSRARSVLERRKVPELKQILHALDLTKSGTKRELIDRICGYMSTSYGLEKARQVVDADVVEAFLSAAAQPNAAPAASPVSTYQRTNASGPATLTGPANSLLVHPAHQRMRGTLQQHQRPGMPYPSASAGSMLIPAAALPKPVKGPVSAKFQTTNGPVVFRCPCETIVVSKGSTVQCKNCLVLQHADCVWQQRTSLAEIGFLCELCRFHACDPFWRIEEILIYPFKLQMHSVHGSAARCTKSFSLSTAHVQALRADSALQLQLRCLDLKPTEAEHRWPRIGAVKINDVTVLSFQPMEKKRPRDDFLSMAKYCNRPQNLLDVISADSEPMAMVVVLARSQPLPSIITSITARQLVSYETAKARVLKLLFGALDEEVVAHEGSTVVSLKDPITLTRMQTPVRGSRCSHLSCFDLPAYLQMNQTTRTKRWKCPICGGEARPNQLLVDLYISSLLQQTQHPADAEPVTEIELAENGSWTVPKEERKKKRSRSDDDGSETETDEEQTSGSVTPSTANHINKFPRISDPSIPFDPFHSDFLQPATTGAPVTPSARPSGSRSRVTPELVVLDSDDDPEDTGDLDLNHPPRHANGPFSPYNNRTLSSSQTRGASIRIPGLSYDEPERRWSSNGPATVPAGGAAHMSTMHRLLSAASPRPSWPPLSSSTYSGADPPATDTAAATADSTAYDSDQTALEHRAMQFSSSSSSPSLSGAVGSHGLFPSQPPSTGSLRHPPPPSSHPGYHNYSQPPNQHNFNDEMSTNSVEDMQPEAELFSPPLEDPFMHSYQEPADSDETLDTEPQRHPSERDQFVDMNPNTNYTTATDPATSEMRTDDEDDDCNYYFLD